MDCSILLLDVYSLRLLAYRVLIPQLANATPLSLIKALKCPVVL